MWKSGVVVALALLGCSSSSPSAPDPTGPTDPTEPTPPTAVDVTIAGTHYHAAQAISSPIPSAQSSKLEAGMIVLSSSTDACTPPDARVQHPGETTIVILLEDVINDQHSPPSAPGTYTIVDLNSTAPSPPPTHIAVMYATVLNAQCANDGSTGASARSGTVALTALDNGAYAGRFDAFLDSGDHVTGTFDADLCAQLPAELASHTPAACTP